MRKFYPVFLTALLLICVGFLLNTKQKLQLTKKELNAANIKWSQAASISNNQFIVEQNNWDAQLNSLNNIELININEKQLSLYELLEERNLIFYFDNVMCSDCIKEEIENFKSLMKIIDNSINTLVLVNGFKNRVIYQNEQLKIIKNRVYQIKEPLFSWILKPPNPMIILTQKNQIKISYTALKNTNLNFELFSEIIQKSNGMFPIENTNNLGEQ